MSGWMGKGSLPTRVKDELLLGQIYIGWDRKTIHFVGARVTGIIRHLWGNVKQLPFDMEAKTLFKSTQESKDFW